MNDKKYPIGTKIRFLYKEADTNKIGTIVAISSWGNPVIFLPTAEKHISGGNYPKLRNGTKYSWKCTWYEIEKVAEKNQQLYFDSIYEQQIL